MSLVLALVDLSCQKLHHCSPLRVLCEADVLGGPNTLDHRDKLERIDPT